MKVPTVKFIFKRWIRIRLDIHTPSTYSRAWRTLKSGTELDDIDVNKVEEIKNKSAETTWKLVTGI